MEYPLSLQQAFNRVWNTFVIERQKPGYNISTVTCEYLSVGGERCAIGCCLPVEVANKWQKIADSIEKDKNGFISNGISSIPNDEVIRYFNCDMNDLESLQGIHDNWAFKGDLSDDSYNTLRLRLEEFATERGLIVPTE